jgi:hypothetical protein
MKPEIENLKAHMIGVKLNFYQKGLALDEFYKLIDYVTELEKLSQPLVSGSLPSDDVPLMIWANVYNPIKTDSWDLHHTEASAVKNSIGAKTHCYIHESLLGNDR